MTRIDTTIYNEVHHLLWMSQLSASVLAAPVRELHPLSPVFCFLVYSAVCMRILLRWPGFTKLRLTQLKFKLFSSKYTFSWEMSSI